MYIKTEKNGYLLIYLDIQLGTKSILYILFLYTEKTVLSNQQKYFVSI